VVARHHVPLGEQLTIDDILAADTWAREEARLTIGPPTGLPINTAPDGEHL
jgi:1-deoxy-D-xylulose-5-phosphate reductoisomerase